MNLQEIRSYYKLPNAYIDKEVQLCDVLNLGHPPAGNKEESKYQYSAILKRRVPNWIVSNIEYALLDLNECAEKGFMCIEGYDAIEFNWRNRERADKLVDAMNKYFNQVGVCAHVISWGSRRHPSVKVKVGYLYQGSDRFQVGKVIVPGKYESDAKMVIQCRKLYKELYKLMYSYSMFCAENKLVARIPFTVSRYKTCYTFYREVVQELHENNLNILKNKLTRAVDRVDNCISYFNLIKSYKDVEVLEPRIEDCRNWYLLRFDLKAGDKIYQYKDGDLLSNHIVVEDDLFYALQDSVRAELCAYMYYLKTYIVEKQYTVSKRKFRTDSVFVDIVPDDEDSISTSPAETYRLTLGDVHTFDKAIENPTGSDYIETLEDKLTAAEVKYRVALASKLEYEPREKYQDKIEWF